jgi:hypothetical protein
VLASVGLVTVYTNKQVPSSQGSQTESQIQPFSHTIKYNFDNETTGSLPAYLRAGVTGGGTRSEWSVKQDSTSPSPPNVLAQTADEAVDYHFPYVVSTGQDFRDVNASVSFKTISGRIDQAAGIIFGFVDSGDYYVLRANALEGNVILFKNVGGVRSSIASAPVSVSAGQWHSLVVVATGDTLVGYVDGRPAISVRDPTYSQGKVGLWTKADSVTFFDDLVIEY